MLLKLWDETRAVARAWSRYECSSLSAAIAFYAALSLVPLVLTLIAAIGIFLEFFKSGQDARAHVLTALSEQFSPQMADSLDQVLAGMQAGALVNGPLAAAAFLFTATLAFTQIDKGFERIWETKASRRKGAWHRAGHIVLRRLRSLALLAASSVLLLLVFAAGFVLRGFREFAREILPEVPWSGGLESILLGFFINFAVFTILYYFLSKQRVGWVLSLRSALVAALLWEGGSRILAGIAIGDKFSAYGLIGSFLGVLLWIYYNIMVLFLGALLIRIRFEPASGSLGTTPQFGE